MIEAIFIKNNTCKYLCNICSEEIEEDKIIGLTCNPDKHIFCYDCIIEWYKQLKTKKNNNHNYNITNMCPICRNYGGLIPVYKDDEMIKGIHIITKPKINHQLCGIKLLTKNTYCKFIGKPVYNNLCGVHAHLYKPDSNIISNKCGYKYISKEGYCNLNGKSEYNNLCKIHYKKSILENSNSGVIII